MSALQLEIDFAAALPPVRRRFDGATFKPKRDRQRLSAQYDAVFRLMADGVARSLPQIHAATGFPEASVSARLRDMRKPRFGGHHVARQNMGGGLWLYTLTVNRKTTNPI